MKYNYAILMVLLLLGTGVKAQQTIIWSDDFETDKGWTLTGEFERGTPSGGNGDHGNPNPTSAFNGSNVIGTNLNGGYPDDLTDRVYTAVSPIIDCSGKINVELNFMRWLNVEGNAYDNVYIDVFDGSSWKNVWANGTITIGDDSWTSQTLDISSVADNNADVQIRFALGSTDYMWNFSGWNIDDVELSSAPDPVSGDYQTRKSANWTSKNTWQRFNGTIWLNTNNDPGENGNAVGVTIQSGHTITTNDNRPNTGYAIQYLVVENGGTLRYATNTMSLTVEGAVSGAGFVDMTRNNLAHNLTVGGDFLPSTFKAGSATVILNGSSTQQVGGFTYNNLTVSGGGDKELQGDVIIDGTLNLNGAKIILGDNDLIISDGASISGTFSSTNMIVTNGSGRLIKKGNANADYQMVYPVGTGSNYSPYEITSLAASDATGAVEVRAVNGVAPGPPSTDATDLQKYWEITQTGLTVTSADVSFSYDNAEVGSGGNQSAYVLQVYSGGAWMEPSGASAPGSNPMTASGVADIAGVWTAIEQAPIVTYYSYRSGNWNDVSTWTHDPGGTTHTATDIPGDNAKVVLLNGRTVTLISDVTNTGLSMAILSGGFLNMSAYQFTNALVELSGQGTLKLASANFPNATDNYLVTTSGGTVEYNNTSNYNLPSTQAVYNHLTINGSAIATQKHNLTIYGDLHIKQGTYRINDGSNARRQLSIDGNVTVDSGAAITVGTGNTVANDVSGGTAPFIDYYENQTHRVVVNGDFTNNGIVRFTNQNYPQYTTFPSNGAATVYFRGAADNTLTCIGQTDFYNLVLDKGTDQTFKLNIYSSSYQNFRLFGRNSYGGDTSSSGGSDQNPNLRKALWIRTGTMVLQGLTVIPSLSEGGDGGTPNSDFYIPVNGALVLDGPDVVVLATADDYTEVNAAYGLSGGSNGAYGINEGSSASSFSIYGKVQVDDGYFSTRESGGFITWDKASGEFIVNGGTVDAKQFRAAGGADGLASYTQTGGTVLLRGQFQRSTAALSSVSDLVNASLDLTRKTNGLDGSKGTLNINNPDNIFSMSGGTLKVLGLCGTSDGYAIDIFSAAKNINVSGGTIEILPQKDNYTFKVRSSAPFGNLIVNRVSGNSEVQLNNSNLPSGVTVNGDLIVLGDVTLTSGALNANNFDVTVGGDFSLANGTTYTTGSNRTIFNGSDKQELTIELASALQFNKLVVNKTASQLLLKGSQATVNVADSLILSSGELNDNGKTINVSGNTYNAGTHSGDGQIVMSGSSINGNGSGVFQNIQLNRAGEITLNANTTINGTLTFAQDRLLNIGTNNISFATGAIIAGSSASRYIKTAGNAGDGGVTFAYNSTTAKTWPIGVDVYSPATIGFTSAPTAYGDITVVPVNYEHPTTTTDGEALDYFWRIKSSGFTGFEGKVSHSFNYDQSDVQGAEANYLPARYDAASYNWNKGSIGDVDESGTTNQINDWTTPTQSAQCIDGDYTAGLNSAFGTPKKYYSRVNNGLWRDASTWSTVSHSGGAASDVPGGGDIVIIGNGHTVSLYRSATPSWVDKWWNGNYPWSDPKDEDVHSCASLQIEIGAVLDIKYNPGSAFGMVMTHPSGNGRIKVSTGYYDGATFEFPSGDFSDFNANQGTTELYTINSNGGTTYYLPNGITEYGNLVIHPVGGSNIIFPNHDVMILGDLTTQGTDAGSWFSPAWSGSGWNEKTITVKGDLNIDGGSLYWYGNGSVRQDVIVFGDVTVAAGAAICSSNATNQSLSIGGSLINNSNALDSHRSVKGCYFDNIPLIFFGDGDAKITSTGGTPETTFGTITVNKGSSQATSLTMDIGGTIDFDENEWLKLQNGTFIYESNRGSSVYLNSNNSYTIPGTAALIHNSTDDFALCYGNNDDYDLYLNGKLTVKNGRFYVGNSSNNKNIDIEYSGAGLSEIDVQGGELHIAGQVRRNPASSAGILKYNQSAGSVTIYGRNARADRAKLEILNAGSEFNMSGGTLSIVRGGGTTFGDLYLRPENASVTGGDIVFANGSAGVQNYLLDANVPLNNLTIDGNASNATVKLLLSPLELNGDLTLANSRSIFDANSSYDIAVTINGDFNNSGVYNFYKNTTTFSGNTQQIAGSSSVEFYNLVVNSVTSLTLSKDVTVNNDLTISNGTLAVGANAINVKGNVINNSTYTSTGSGLVLNGTVVQELSGTGTFARLELNNNLGASLLSDLSVEGELALTNGVLNIKNHLLSLGETASISGTFGVGNMITTNGVYSNQGVKKIMPSGDSPAFTFPLGVAGKYTPAVVDLSANSSVASIIIHPVNAKHPANIDAANVLNYYWAVKSEALSLASGSFKLTYDEGDVQGDEANYYGARLLVPGTSWSKNHAVDEATNVISFTISGDDITGEYTAGLQSAFPDNVPEYTSNGNGVWTNPSNWVQTGGDSYTLTGAPNGFIVVIKDEITLDDNFASAYRTHISTSGKLKIDDTTYGHNLGTVSGDGTLYLEEGQLPEGDYTAFLGCSNNSTLEFGGTAKNYAIIGDLFNNAANLIFSGTGMRTLPDADLTVCKQLIIDGPVLDNSVYNRTLFVNGSFTRLSGSFKSGTGNTATVSFTGSAEQYIGGFTGADNTLNNLEVNNAAGLTLDGAIEVAGKLMLTNGLINTTYVNSLTITNTSTNCVTPSGGKGISFVNGPLTKKMNQSDSFVFPIGKDGVLGNKLVLTSTRTGTKLWTAEYIKPNATSANFTFPLTAINSHEYYTISTPGGGEARVQLGWNSGSDITPSMTEHGLTDIRVVNYDGVEWQEIASTATGVDASGQVITNVRVVVDASGTDFTTATVNTNKPKVRFNPGAAICDLSTGIRVEMTSTVPTAADYELLYTVNGGAVQTVTVSAFPYNLPTSSIGVYELTGFKYDNKVRTGVVDHATIEVFASPTAANAGADQSLQGLSQATLDANTAVVGVGQWEIVSGTGGSFVDPSNPKTIFNGTNGSAYELSWTITNGDCESVDIVKISFPLLPAHTWVGGVSADWFDVDNWTDKMIPDNTHDVTINAVSFPAVDPVVDGTVLAQVGDLTIQPGASLTVKPGARFTIHGDLITNNSFVIENTVAKPASVITNGLVTGNVTTQWTYSELHWWFVGHSISNPQVDTYRNIIVTDPTNKYALYDYAASGKLLNRGVESGFDFTTTYPDANEVIRGYQFKVLKPVTIVHTGVLNNEVSYSKDVQSGWQIIANPYPAYYQVPVDNGDFAETQGTVYITRARTNADKIYEAFNTSSGITSPSDFDGVIAPSQAFYVETLASPSVGAKITMRASQRTNGAATPSLKSGLKSSRKILRLKLSNEHGLTDEAAIALFSDGDIGLTRQDSKQRFYSGTNYSYIYSIIEGTNAVINVLPDELVDYQQVLGIQTKAGKQQLSIAGLEQLSDNYEIVLEDKSNNALTPMTSSTIYEFSAEEGIDDKRFVLHFKVKGIEVPTGIGDDEASSSNVKIYMRNESTMLVTCDWDSYDKTLEVYTVTGSLVMNDEFSGEFYETELNVQPGIYIVKLHSGNYSYQVKVFVR